MNRWNKSAAVAALLVMATMGAAAAGPEAPADRPILISAPADLLRDVTADRTLPEAIQMDGQAITFDQGPMIVAANLMVPLRAIVEAAGGKVTWEDATRTVTVRIGDRTATFVIGEGEAELIQDGYRYLQRNMLKMNHGPVLVGGRTLISADALTSILGLQERPGTPGVLNLVRPYPASPGAPVEQDVTTGTIKELTGERILIEGGPMSSGEPYLVWVSIGPDTVFTTGSREELKVGQQVEVVIDGAVLMSYPAQAGAAEIRILD